MFNPFKAVARWWRRRKFKGIMVVDRDEAGNIVTRPYDGSPIYIAGGEE